MTFTANVGLDNYYLQYEVKVGAYNVHGDGPNSTVAVIFSAEGSKYSLSLKMTCIGRSVCSLACSLHSLFFNYPFKILY